MTVQQIVPYAKYVTNGADSVYTVNFFIEDKENFLERKSLFLDKFLELLKDEQSEFTNAITKGTSGKGAVETRFKIMNELIREVLNENWESSN